MKNNTIDIQNISSTAQIDSKVELNVSKTMAAVGFEPTPSKWLVPKTSALDRSATLPPNFDVILCVSNQ